MKPMLTTTRVAAVTMRSEMGSPAKNLERINHWVAQASDPGASCAM
ncbi:MAG: hypothetical protein O2857_03120 [Planctomycetota bacterium]|nr:hypothetical protein [Planctomycetota bacterium]